jgi:hypothetical protein
MKFAFSYVSCFFLLTILFSSCRKCLNCTTVNSAGKVITTYPQTCGKKATLDVQELNYRKYIPDSLTLNCSRAKD